MNSDQQRIIKEGEISWDYKKTIVNGLKSGVYTTWILAKVIVPVYFVITFLKYVSILDKLSQLCAPIMDIVGLPGEAALPLVLGNIVNVSASIAAIASLHMSPKEVTIITVMLSFSHSLLTETAVAKKTGLSIIVVLTIRVTLAIFSGVILNFIL